MYLQNQRSHCTVHTEWTLQLFPSIQGIQVNNIYQSKLHYRSTLVDKCYLTHLVNNGLSENEHSQQLYNTALVQETANNFTIVVIW